MKFRIILAALLPVLAATSHGTVIVNETFADGDRTTQNPPDSIQWTYGAHRSSEAFTSLTASDNKLLWDHTSGANSSFSAIWGHFASTSPAIGETLRLSFTVSFSSAGNAVATDGAFRWALLNSGGSQVTTDFAGSNATGIQSGTTFASWTGYQGDTAVAGTPNSSTLQIRERKGSGSSLFTSSNWDVRANGNTSATGTSDITVLLDVTRTASGVTIGTSYGGTSITYVDSSASTTSFDTIAFFTLDSLSKDITLSNIKLETLIIPEPTSALLSALGFAGFAFRRKRIA